MGRDKRNEKRVEHYTKMIRSTMQTPAWKALSTTAQALYPWLKLEWKGPDANNNGSIQLSTHQAAERLGVAVNTAARAFHDLQAKGFIVVKKPAVLGVSGEAKGNEYELTELAPPGPSESPRKLFKDWRKGHDFPVVKARANNPRGINGRKIRTNHDNDDRDVINFETKRKSASSK